jgi:hypothetical protein
MQQSPSLKVKRLFKRTIVHTEKIMNSHPTKKTEQEKLAAKKDLIARLDRAVELASELERQARAMETFLEENHSVAA